MRAEGAEAPGPAETVSAYAPRTADAPSTGPWMGRPVPFALEPADGPPFDRRLRLPERPRAGWIVLTYRSPAAPRPMRPMIRFLRASGAQDVVLPGIALAAAHWLGYLPPDLREIRLAAEPGFVLERVGVRSHAGVLAQCLGKRPLRAVSAAVHALRGDERRFRDSLRGVCATTPLGRYAAWARPRRRPPEAAVPASHVPIRLILLAGRPDAPGVAETVASLTRQTHPAWSLDIACAAGSAPAAPDPAVPDPRVRTLVWDAAATPAALLGDAGAFGLLQPGDRLAPDALAILGAALSGPEAAEFAYADEEVGGAPRLKPDWSPDLALVTGYPGGPALIARALVERLDPRPVGPLAAFATDLGLAVAGRARRVVHVPRVLAHGPARPGEADRGPALARHLRAVGSPASCATREGVLDLVWPVPEPAPLASIVVPSKDRLDLIRCVTDGVLRATDYAAIELIVVDNGSTDPEVLALYDRLRTDARVRILHRPGPFNFSGLVNAGMREARGRVAVLLNNDIAVLRPDWLAILVAQAVRPEVGAVGARLLYADGRLQHGGVVVGLGGRAGHILRRRAGDAPGHLGRMRVAHEVSAVTAACLAVERAKYEAVGGFDECDFPVDFNDVDFCLRLGRAGYRTVWTPWAVLSHLESVSRGPPVGEARRRFEREGDTFAARWRDVVRHDPFYHPALSLTTFGEELE